MNPASQLALAMADLEAEEQHLGDALEWLEVGAEHSPLPRSYEAKRRAWLVQVRRSRDLTPRSGRRRVTPDLPVG